MLDLNSHTVHVWTCALDITPDQAHQYQSILSSDEQERAARFHFDKHRLRFIAAHYQLRAILSQYTHIDPSKLEFGHNDHKKPYIKTPASTSLHFNLSHSDLMAVVAIGLDYELGIDIEKMQDKSNLDIAARFFSKDEWQQLQALDHDAQRIAFYRIWSRKEAVIKATGKGLAQMLPAFTVSANDITESIQVGNDRWQLIPIAIDPAYQSALACHPSITHTDLFAFEDMLTK